MAGSSFRSLRMKNSSSSSSRDRGREALVAAQDDRGFEGVADQFFLACLFDCLPDNAAEFEQLLHFCPNDGSRKLPCGSGNNWRWIRVRSLARRVAPRFLRGEDEDRREQPAERVENLVHRHLRGAAARRIGRVAIHAVLRDVDIEAAQVDGAELIQGVINLVEFVGRIGRAAFFDDLLQPIENPAIDQGEFALSRSAIPVAGKSCRLPNKIRSVFRIRR